MKALTFDMIERVLEENEIRIDGDFKEDRSIDLQFFSPLGEDFWFTIYFDGQPADFIYQFCSYQQGFDPDEHAAMWIANRGKHGTPSSVRDLIDDADAIDDRLQEIAWQLEKLI